jgi:hypothetical protein
MAAHITYLSEETLSQKFGRRLQDREAKSFGFGADFQVESYLRYQGESFTSRFDANSYLYITRAMSYFDLAEERWRGPSRRLAEAFAGVSARFCVVSFDTDWLYPTSESRKIAHALNAAGAPVSFMELAAPFGHDSFLLDVPALDRVIAGSSAMTACNTINPAAPRSGGDRGPCGARRARAGCRLRRRHADGGAARRARLRRARAGAGPANVAACVARGLSAIQGDADTDLTSTPMPVSITPSCRRRCKPPSGPTGAGGTAAHRAARFCVLSQFRALGRAAGAADAGGDAGDAPAAGGLV